jgi:hypothetical protein
MADAEMLLEQTILSLDHVVVIVAWELRLHAFGRLRRSSVPDRVRDDDVIFGGVERLPGAEQFASEIRRQHAVGGAARAMQHQDGLA